MSNILKKRNLILLFYVLSATVIIIIFFSISPPQRLVISNQSKSNINVGEIYEKRKIGQTFVAEYNNLISIHVLLATFNRENSGRFFFHLKNDLSSKDDMYSYVKDISEVEDNKYFQYQFSKIRDSKGNKFYFYFDAPESQPGNAITLWSNSSDSYKGGEKIVNGVVAEGDLVFKTEYQLGMRMSFAAFLGNIIKFKTFFVNTLRNKALYFLLLIIVFIWIFITFSKKVDIFNKKGGFILIYCILLMAIFIWIFVSFSKKKVSYNQHIHNTSVGEIFGDTKIGQAFLADYNNLSAIEVLLATYNRKNSGEFIFHLKNDVSDEEDLFAYKGDISKVKDNKYFNFEFPKIRDSRGKKLYFYLEAPQSQPGNAITLWSNSSDLYPEGEIVVDGETSKGDLVFKTIYDSGFKGNFNIFFENISQNKPFPLNKKLFYIILILMFTLSSSLFMTFLAKFLIES